MTDVRDAKPKLQVDLGVAGGVGYSAIKHDCLPPYQSAVVGPRARLNVNFPEDYRRLRFIVQGELRFELKNEQNISEMNDQCIAVSEEGETPVNPDGEQPAEEPTADITAEGPEKRKPEEGEDKPEPPRFPGQEDVIEPKDPKGGKEGGKSEGTKGTDGTEGTGEVEGTEGEGEITDGTQGSGPAVNEVIEHSHAQRFNFEAWAARAGAGFGWDFLELGENNYFLGAEALGVVGYGRYLDDPVAPLDLAKYGVGTKPKYFLEGGFEVALPFTWVLPGRRGSLVVSPLFSRTWRSINAENPDTGNEINDTTTVMDTTGAQVLYRFSGGRGPATPPETQCTDGVDNDGDGRVDGADSDCATLACQDHDFTEFEDTARDWRTKLFINPANEHEGLKPEVVAALQEMEAEDYVIDSLQVAIVAMPTYDASGNSTGIEPQVVLTVRHPNFTWGKLVIFEDTTAHPPLIADALLKRVEELDKAKKLEAAKERICDTYRPDQYQFNAGRPQEAQLTGATAISNLADFERYVKDAGILANYSAVRRNLHATADVIKALNTLADGSVQFYLHATSSVEGSDDVNMTLSIRRAQFIGKWLTLLGASPQEFVGTGEVKEFLAHPDNVDTDARSRNLTLRSRATENRAIKIVFGEQDVNLSPEPTSDELAQLKVQEDSPATSDTIKVLKASATDTTAVQVKPAKFHEITFLAYIELEKQDLPEGQSCTAILASPYKIKHTDGTFDSDLQTGYNGNPADNIALRYPESPRLTDADAFYAARNELQGDIASASASVGRLVNTDLATLTDDAAVRAEADRIYKKLELLEILERRNERLILTASNAEEDTFDTNVFFWSSNDTKHRVAYKRPLYEANRLNIIESHKKLVEFFRRLQAHKPTPPTPTTFTLGSVVVAGYADGAGKVIINYTGPTLTRANIKVIGKNGSEKKATAGNPDPVEVTGDKITISFSGIGAGKKYFYTIQQKDASGNFADLIKVEFTASTGIATVSYIRPAPAPALAPAAPVVAAAASAGPAPAPTGPAPAPTGPAPAPTGPAPAPTPDPAAEPALPDPEDLTK